MTQMLVCSEDLYSTIVEFKSVSPYFEVEESGDKNNTERVVDWKDPRFKVLQQWAKMGMYGHIKITRAGTPYDSFIRQVKDVSFWHPYPDEPEKLQIAIVTWRA